MVVASAPIAATTLRRLCASRAPTALLAAVLLTACTGGGGDDRPEPATSTTAAAVACPDGSVVPDAEPAATPPPMDVAPSGPAGRDGALDIGTLLPRTGDLAFLGPAAVAGVELAVADIEEAGGVLGAPIGLRHGDSARDLVEGELAALLEGGADVVIGPLASATTASVLDAVAGADAVLVSPASGSNGLDALDRSGRLFRTGTTEDLQGRALTDLVLDDGHRTVSIAARADDYGRSIADSLTAALEERGGSVVARTDYDPTTDDLGTAVLAGMDTSADALVVVGLAETALVIDALVAEGGGPRDRPVYGTDGNLGERLGDLVADRAELACLRGVLPVAQPDDDFADRIRAHDPALAELGAAGLDWAAESYDATVVAALAAASAGSDGGAALSGAMAAVTSAGTPCSAPEDCLDSIAAGVDVAYVGQTGRLALDGDGNRTEAGVTVVAIDGEGHLARLGSRRVRR